MHKPQLLYIHSGGVTSVLNRTFASLAEQAAHYGYECITAPHGILGVLKQQWHTYPLPFSDNIPHTPASVISTSRHKPTDAEIQHCVDIMHQNNIQAFIIQGGNDSQDTVARLHQACVDNGYPIQCLGLAKTIDNDLVDIHVSPGYPSAAKYLAISFMEAAWDMISMHHTSSKVMILETMGRSSGWLAAATTLVSQRYDLPHILCVPEHLHDISYLSDCIHDKIVQHGYCLITLAEGYNFSSIADTYIDPFGHPKTDGQGQYMAEWIHNTLHVKTRYVKPDILQRSCGHVVSQYDWDLAHNLARGALEAVIAGKSGVMVATASEDCHDISLIDVKLVANRVRHLHPSYLNSTGCNTTHSFTAYLEPLITGEVYPQYQRGLPQYARSFSFSQPHATWAADNQFPLLSPSEVNL